MSSGPRRDRGAGPRLAAALDELRFGPHAILNLREGLPTAEQARTRARNFLREHQVRGTREVLIVTGRGNQSDAGIAVIRDAIERLLHTMRRQGVIASHQPHNPGAFAVTLAPIRDMVDAPPRRRDPRPRRVPAGLEALAPETVTLLRELADVALAALGVRGDDATIEHEMHRQLAALLPGVESGARREEALRAALRLALAEYD